VRRALQPRQTATAPIVPQTITDLTCPTAAGFEPRTFREVVAREGIPHARIGRRIVVLTCDWLDAIERIGRRQSGDSAIDDNELTTDRLLARIGRVRRVGGRP
jgi:hypothetical protein